MTRVHNFIGDAVMLAVAGLLALFGRGGSTLPDDDMVKKLADPPEAA